MSYQFYIQDVRALLSDQGAAFYSTNQLTRWINQARSSLAKRTACIQRMVMGQSPLGAGAQPGFITVGGMEPGALPNSIPAASNSVAALNQTANGVMTIAGLERYPYRGFWNPILQQQYAGVKGVIDTTQLAVSWGSAYRPALDWRPFDEFQAYCRAYANQTTSYPCVWTTFNDGEEGEIWLFPSPSQAQEMEAHFICVPKDIFSDDDFDAIPDGFRDAVKFRAAELAFYTSQKYAQAQVMGQLYLERIGVDVVARDFGKVGSWYPLEI